MFDRNADYRAMSQHNYLVAAPLHDRVGMMWMNGDIVPSSAAMIHVLSHSLHYGTAVFEGVRVYGGQVFASEAHYTRLAASAAALGYAIPFTFRSLVEATDELVCRNGILDGYVRAIAWLGSEALGLTATDLSVNVAIAVWDWPQVHRMPADAPGVSVYLSDIRRPGYGTLPVQAKASGCYLVGVLAYQVARRHGHYDAILLDHEGMLAESTSANLFLVRDGILHTPLADRFLNGLTRQTVMMLARDLGIQAIERRISPAELMSADEAFLTGTAVEVLPIKKIGDIEKNVGPISLQLRDAYARHVRGNQV
jgi:branched-chain amino acid aminotransferase